MHATSWRLTSLSDQHVYVSQMLLLLSRGLLTNSKLHFTVMLPAEAGNQSLPLCHITVVTLPLGSSL